MAKFGKKIKVNNGMENFMIGIMGPSGFGKTSLMYHVCQKKFGDEGYILLDLGDEDGVAAIDGVTAEHVPTFKMFKEIVDDIVKNKNTDYPQLKVIILDTLDALFNIAEQYTISTYNREHMGEQNFRSATSINSVEGGFGRGMDRVVDTVKKELTRLKNAGVGVWWTSHVKERDQTDLFTGASYTQLTASMTMRYFNSIRDISHLIGFGYYDRSIQKIEVGEVNPVTKKKKTREITTSENRKIKFRDDSLVADAKSRFSSIVDEINLDTDEFIQAVEAAIKEASTATSTPAPKKVTPPKEESVEEPEESLEDHVTVTKEEADELHNMGAVLLNDEDEDLDYPPFDVDDEEEKEFDVEEAKAKLRELFKSGTKEQKAKVKELRGDKTLAQISDQETIEKMLAVFDN